MGSTQRRHDDGKLAPGGFDWPLQNSGVILGRTGLGLFQSGGKQQRADGAEPQTVGWNQAGNYRHIGEIKKTNKKVQVLYSILSTIGSWVGPFTLQAWVSSESKNTLLLLKRWACWEDIWEEKKQQLCSTFTPSMHRHNSQLRWNYVFPF